MIPLKRHLEKSDSGTQKADGSRNSKQLLNEYEALLEIVYELSTHWALLNPTLTNTRDTKYTVYLHN